MEEDRKSISLLNEELKSTKGLPELIETLKKEMDSMKSKDELAARVELLMMNMNAKNKSIEEALGSLSYELKGCTSRADVASFISREIDKITETTIPQLVESLRVSESFFEETYTKSLPEDVAEKDLLKVTF